MDAEREDTLKWNNVKPYITSLTEKLKCLICKKLPEDPYLLWCRHTYCKGCITPLCKCPQCAFPLTPKDMVPDLMLAKLVTSIKLVDEISRSFGKVRRKETVNENPKQMVTREKIEKELENPKLTVKVALVENSLSLQKEFLEDIDTVGKMKTGSKFKCKLEPQHTGEEKHKSAQTEIKKPRAATPNKQRGISPSSDHSVDIKTCESNVKYENQTTGASKKKQTSLKECILTENKILRKKLPNKQRGISLLEEDHRVNIETTRLRGRTNVKCERVLVGEGKQKPVKECTLTKNKHSKTKSPDKPSELSLLEKGHSVATETCLRGRKIVKCEIKKKHVEKEEEMPVQESFCMQSKQLEESPSSSFEILSTSTPKHSTVSVEGSKHLDALDFNTIKNKDDTTRIKGRQCTTPKLEGSVSRGSSRKACIASSVKRPPSRNSLNAKGETPLQIACRQGKLDMVQKLLRSGANPNVKDYANWTPLCDAVGSNNVEVVKALLDAGATVNVPAHLNTTALVEAVLKRNKEMVSLLLCHGADMHQRTAFNNTAFSIADDEMKAFMESKSVTVKKPLPTLKTVPTVVLAHELPQRHEDKVVELCQAFNLTLTTSFVDEISHIVVEKSADNTCHGSVTVMQGMLHGCAVVGMDWVVASLQAGQLLPPDQFEPNGTNDYPETIAFKRARINKESLLPKLFDGCHISLQHDQVWPVELKHDLMTLIQQSGAQFLARQCDPESIPEDESTVMYHVPAEDPLGLVSHIILFQTDPAEPLLQYNMPHVKSLPYSWFLQCIKTFSIF